MPIEIDGVELTDEQVVERFKAAQAAEAEAEQLRTENANLSEQNQTLAKADRTRAIDERIATLTKAPADGGLGLSEEKHAGFLRVTREVLTADEGQVALNLSENGKTVGKTASDLWQLFIDALPRDAEQRLMLGEQANVRSAGDPPPSGEQQTLTVAEQAQAVVTSLQLPSEYQARKAS